MEANEVIGFAIFVLAVIFFVGGIWLMICNHRTWKQRMQIIDWIFDSSSNWRRRNAEYDQVSYDQHMWALFTFRNPRKLYNFKELG